LIKRLVTVVVLLCAVCLAKDPKYPVKEIDKLVNGIVSWGGKLNSPGTKAELREVGRQVQRGRILVTYDVYVTGAPRDQTYAVYQWPITMPEPQVVLPAVSIAKDGQVCFQVTPACVGPIQFGHLPGKGEPFRVLFISRDGQYRVTALVVPDPITSADQGCSLEVVRVTPKFEAALVRGKGFKPNENVAFTSNSAGERLDLTATADANGNFDVVLAPFVKHKDTGVDTVNFKASACAPAISFKWGTTED